MCLGPRIIIVAPFPKVIMEAASMVGLMVDIASHAVVCRVFRFSSFSLHKAKKILDFDEQSRDEHTDPESHSDSN